MHSVISEINSLNLEKLEKYLNVISNENLSEKNQIFDSKNSESVSDRLFKANTKSFEGKSLNEKDVLLLED